MKLNSQKIGEFYARNTSFLIGGSLIVIIASFFVLGDLRISFSFDQFFPDNDPDMEEYRDFISDFESDENFLLLALEAQPSIFSKGFYRDLRDITQALDSLESIESVQSLSKLNLPVFSGFSPRFEPLINPDAQDISGDSAQLVNDPRISGRFIHKEASATQLFIKTNLELTQSQNDDLIENIRKITDKSNISDYHLLGRSYFQSELSEFQLWEVLKIAAISVILLFIIMWVMFRRFYVIMIAAITIAAGFAIFLGFMGVTGRELGFLAALYPLLLIIVGTSDIIHILSKYLQESDLGNSKEKALGNTLKEIGIATFLTSVTTAAGFASLYSSRLGSIRDFGLNASVGVFIAYVVTIILGGSLIYLAPVHKLKRSGSHEVTWNRYMNTLYVWSGKIHIYVPYGAVALGLLLAYGISRVSTNSEIAFILPEDQKVTEDFFWFQENISGFRPLEFVIEQKKSDDILETETVRSIHRFEERLAEIPTISSIQSLSKIYKDLNWTITGEYEFPEDSAKISQYTRLVKPMTELMPAVLISKGGDKTRITARLNDIGTDSVSMLQNRLNTWVNQNIDTSNLSISPTGIGFIFDKNAEYVRRNLLVGLMGAILLVSVFLALLFQSFRLFIIALIPNLVPLLFAGALMGFLGIGLEAGTTIVFAVIFGIAVDDSIHFISRYRLAYRKTKDIEESLKETFRETVRALILTTIVLFVGFIVLLLSQHYPTRIIGMLISTTLISALVCDLILIPWLIRILHKNSKILHS